MIPKYEPPFSFPDLLRSAFHSPSPDMLAAERFFSDHLGVAYAVSIPSGRAGICWAVKAAIGQEGGMVVTPAYTCRVVHEAIHYAGAVPFYLDCGPDSFLPDLDRLLLSPRIPGPSS
jgi:dTDP-4-amino-4,6-dideoxygalactose transaminase